MDKKSAIPGASVRLLQAFAEAARQRMQEHFRNGLEAAV